MVAPPVKTGGKICPTDSVDPRSATAVYNRGGARFDLGDLEGAQADFAQALRRARDPAEAAAIRFAGAALSLARGDLAAGWDAYETRHSRHLPTAVVFEGSGRPWAPGAALAGKHLLLIGEQGLGDEIMFANLIPDVLRALGAVGRLSLAVEPRLVDLFARSFPAAEVSAHVTEVGGPRLRRGAPGSIPTGRRTSEAPASTSLPPHPTDFPPSRLSRPDPAQVARWRAWPARPARRGQLAQRKDLGDRRRQPTGAGLGRCWRRRGAVRQCAVRRVRRRARGLPPAAAARSWSRRAGHPDDIGGLPPSAAWTDLCVANATGAGVCKRRHLINPPAAWLTGPRPCPGTRRRIS